MRNLNRSKVSSILKTAKITEAPVDLNIVVAVFGFNILPFPFPDYRKGIVYIDREVRVIGVNSSHPITLQRFTIAHELGHFVNGHQHIDNECDTSEKRFYTRHFQQEKEADMFAGELLIPKDFITKDVSEIGLDEDKLSKRYVVSKQALWIRLKSLGLAEMYS